jgi:hypothetical protein
MKLKFKKQLFQTNAVNAVADCFAGQPKTEGITYRIDTGKIGRTQSAIDFSQSEFYYLIYIDIGHNQPATAGRIHRNSDIRDNPKRTGLSP